MKLLLLLALFACKKQVETKTIETHQECKENYRPTVRFLATLPDCSLVKIEHKNGYVIFSDLSVKPPRTFSIREEQWD